MHRKANEMKVFLSHSSSERSLAMDVASRLSAAGFRVWHGEEVPPGENWALAVGKALEDSDAMVVLLSPDAVKSQAVGHEIEYALSSPRYRNRLLPVVVRPTRGIPWILRRLPIIRLYDQPGAGADRIVEGVRELVQATN